MTFLSSSNCIKCHSEETSNSEWPKNPIQSTLLHLNILVTSLSLPCFRHYYHQHWPPFYFSMYRHAATWVFAIAIPSNQNPLLPNIYITHSFTCFKSLHKCHLLSEIPWLLSKNCSFPHHTTLPQELPVNLPVLFVIFFSLTTT